MCEKMIAGSSTEGLGLRYRRGRSGRGERNGVFTLGRGRGEC